MKENPKKDAEHPSRRKAAEDDANDALEYYDTENKARNEVPSSPPESAITSILVEPLPPPPVPPAATRRPASRPGAFRVRPTSASNPASNNNNNDNDLECSTHSNDDCGNSMVVIPQASLVHGDEAQVSLVVYDEPQELVFASPLPVSNTNFQDLERGKAIAGDAVEDPSPPRNRRRKSVSKERSGHLVLVLNKRWLWLAAMLLCLLLTGIVGGVAYALLGPTNDKEPQGGHKNKNNNVNNNIDTSNNNNDPTLPFPPRDGNSGGNDGAAKILVNITATTYGNDNAEVSEDPSNGSDNDNPKGSNHDDRVRRE